jgi:DNA invertase Pin-like site-specific DNA recombinase
VEYDDNMSAWNPDLTRENWERMLTDVGAGKLRAVVGRYADRLTRQPEQGEALLSACKRGRAELHTTSAGHVTSALMLRIELAMAAEESDQKSRRMTDKHRTVAKAGGFHGGRRRFGYTDGMTAKLDDAYVADPSNTYDGPAEAELIRDAARRALVGESLLSIVRRWNDDGITTPTGKQWRSSNLGKLLRGPHLAGVRVHHGPHNAAGECGRECLTTAAQWPAVIDADTHESLVRFLGNPDRITTGFAGIRKHALSGLLRCGICGGPMFGRNEKLKSGPAYACRTGHHTQAPTARVDATVRAIVVERLANVNASAVFVGPVDAERANARAAERLALADNRRATVRDVRLDPDDKYDALAAIDARVAELDAEAAAEDDAGRLPLRVLDGLTGVPADVVAERFDALPWDARRAVVAVLGTPVLARASRRGVGLPWEPERVTMRWADGPA